MNYLRIGICEDIQEELTALLHMLEESFCICEVESYSGGEAFLRSFYPGRYDLILMDIYMGGINGVETVSRIRELDDSVPIAFLTTSTEHALDGYRFHVDRYLIKPYDAGQLDEVLKMALERLSGRPSITVQAQGQKILLPHSQIIYAEQSGHTCVIHTSGGGEVKTVMKMTELAGMLPDPPFLQCHKSYLVNLGHVSRVNRELMVFEMKGGGVAYIRRGSLRSAEQAFYQYMFSITRGQGGES